METHAAEQGKRGRRQEVAKDQPEVAPVSNVTKRVRITAYKVFTKHGRFIEGQFVELPEAEADALIAEGKAV